MNFQRFSSTIQSDEGFRSNPYIDTVGVPTIGYGTTNYYPDDPVTLADPPISKEAAAQLMQADLFTALEDAQSLFSTFNGMNSVRQEVVCNMAYNLGKSRLAGFKKMIAACDAHDWLTAADEMIDSKWYQQVGARAQRLEQEMRTGIIM